MTFTENFRTEIVGMGAGKSRFLASLRMTKRNNEVGMTKQKRKRNGKRVRGDEEEKQFEVDYGLQGARGVGGALFYGAGQGAGVGSVEAVWGVGAV